LAAKTGRRGKDDDREIKTARIVADVPPSQKEKMRWISLHLRQSIAEIIGGWIDQVFLNRGGSLQDEPGLIDFLNQVRPYSDVELLNLARSSGVSVERLMKVQDCLQKTEEKDHASA
jgi:hypothetical protein